MHQSNVSVSDKWYSIRRMRIADRHVRLFRDAVLVGRWDRREPRRSWFRISPRPIWWREHLEHPAPTAGRDRWCRCTGRLWQRQSPVDKHTMYRVFIGLLLTKPTVRPPISYQKQTHRNEMGFNASSSLQNRSSHQQSHLMQPANALSTSMRIMFASGRYNLNLKGIRVDQSRIAMLTFHPPWQCLSTVLSIRLFWWSCECVELILQPLGTNDLSRPLWTPPGCSIRPDCMPPDNGSLVYLWRMYAQCNNEHKTKMICYMRQCDIAAMPTAKDNWWPYRRKNCCTSSSVPWKAIEPAYMIMTWEKISNSSAVGWWIEHIMALPTVVLCLFVIRIYISISSDAVFSSTMPFVSASVVATVKFFSVLMTFKALKLSKPVVGSSQNSIGGSVSIYWWATANTHKAKMRHCVEW